MGGKHAPTNAPAVTAKGSTWPFIPPEATSVAASQVSSTSTQETLAEMIGTTRSRVSFFMNKFRKLGFIEYNGKLEVHNSLLNVVLHDKPEIKTRDEAIGAE
jgi:hypothetical protein